MTQETTGALPLRAGITELAEQIKRLAEARDQAENQLSEHITELGQAVNRYNRERLSGLIEFLVGKGLAYFSTGRWDNNHRLVREADLSITTERGVEKVSVGDEYSDVVEQRAFVRSYLICRGSREKVYCSTSDTVRNKWMRDFRDRFAKIRTENLPGWLLIALDEGLLPPQPIGLSNSVGLELSEHTGAFVGARLQYADTDLLVICRRPEHWNSVGKDAIVTNISDYF
jgi:hypothetical protein